MNTPTAEAIALLNQVLVDNHAQGFTDPNTLNAIQSLADASRAEQAGGDQRKRAEGYADSRFSCICIASNSLLPALIIAAPSACCGFV